MEILIEIGKWILVSLILLAFMYWNYSIAKKHDKKVLENRGETNAYLDTVVRRIEMSTNADALSLLLDEIENSGSKYNYDRITYQRVMRIKYFLLGKAYGLKKINNCKIEI